MVIFQDAKKMGQSFYKCLGLLRPNFFFPYLSFILKCKSRYTLTWVGKREIAGHDKIGP